jgi:hypothetical protein
LDEKLKAQRRKNALPFFPRRPVIGAPSIGIGIFWPP